MPTRQLQPQKHGAPFSEPPRVLLAVRALIPASVALIVLFFAMSYATAYPEFLGPPAGESLSPSERLKRFYRITLDAYRSPPRKCSPEESDGLSRFERRQCDGFRERRTNSAILAAAPLALVMMVFVFAYRRGEAFWRRARQAVLHGRRAAVLDFRGSPPPAFDTGRKRISTHGLQAAWWNEGAESRLVWFRDDPRAGGGQLLEIYDAGAKASAHQRYFGKVVDPRATVIRGV